MKKILFKVKSQKNIGSDFDKISSKIRSTHPDLFLTTQFLQDLRLSFTEAVANAIEHAGELKRKKFVECQCLVNATFIELRVYDHGPGLGGRLSMVPDFKSFSEKGRGLFLIRQLMDEVLYKKEKGKNVLVMRRTLLVPDDRLKELDLLYEISQVLLQTGDLKKAYQIILQKTVDLFGVKRASIMMQDKTDHQLKIVASIGIKPAVSKKISVTPGTGISGYVFKHAKPCLIEDIATNKSGWEKKKHYRSRSLIVVPMISSPLKEGQKTVGVINLTEKKNGKKFTRKDLHLLTTIANQATAYMNICGLMAENKDVALLRRELDIARKIQQSYLPKTPPHMNGIKLFSWHELPQDVGGDYYDFIPLSDHEMLLVVADVSGHSLASAMTMLNFRSMLRAILRSDMDPADLLSRLNLGLYDDLIQHNQLITVMLAKINRHNKTLDLVLAGHPWPQWLVAKTQNLSTMYDGVAGLPLGIEPQTDFPVCRWNLEIGDRVFFYTDGLVDTLGGKKERFGFERLTEFVTENFSMDGEDFMGFLKSSLKKFRGKNPLSDDCTAVLLDVVP